LLVLLSFGLVLIATVLLVLGLLVGDGLTLIYFSIGLSAVAAVVLFVAVRVSKPSTVPSSAPAPLLPEPERVPVGVGATTDTATTASVTAPPQMAPPPVAPPAAAPPLAAAPPTVAAPAPAAPETGEWLAADQEWDDGEGEWEDEEIEFPIADYDELTEDEILPLLPELYEDEIDVVADREKAGQNRASILLALDDLRGADPIDAGSVAADEDVEDLDEADEADEEDVAEDDLEDAEDVEDEEEYLLPILDYDELSVSEIVSVLGELDDEELEEVKAYEQEGRARTTIIANIDRRLGITVAPVGRAAKRTPARRAAPTRRAPAKKAPVRKVSGQKAAPAKKAPARTAAPARKVAGQKAAPAKKAPARKAPARSSTPAKKRPVTKGAAKKKAPAKKAPARRR
jgi:hypothetical protein